MISDPSVLFVGTYTKKEPHVDGKAKGIYSLELIPHPCGNLKLVNDKIISPSFLTVSRDGKYLLVVTEVGDDLPQKSCFHSFEISPQNELKPINSVLVEGLALCHIQSDPSDKFYFISNYIGGTIHMFSRSENGFLSLTDTKKLKGDGGPNKQRQNDTHVHSSAISTDGTTLFVADLGNDYVWMFQIDYENGKMVENETQVGLKMRAGSGPRHISVHDKEGLVFVINELDNTISILQFDEKEKKLVELSHVSTLPKEFDQGSWCADIHIHPNGKFLYGSNRGHDSIVVFEIDEKNKKLGLVQFQSTRGRISKKENAFPRNFAISPDGKWLYAANQNSDDIVVFSIDQENGKLKYVKECEVLTPVCLAWK